MRLLTTAAVAARINIPKNYLNLANRSLINGFPVPIETGNGNVYIEADLIIFMGDNDAHTLFKKAQSVNRRKEIVALETADNWYPDFWAGDLKKFQVVFLTGRLITMDSGQL